MMLNAWSRIEEVPYCLSNFTVENLRFKSNLSKIIRPVAAIKPLRFALYYVNAFSYDNLIKLIKTAFKQEKVH